MRKHGSAIALIAVFLVGLSLLLYPIVSSFINQKNESKAIASYETAVDEISDEDYDTVLKAAEAYNETLAENPTSFSLSDAELDNYNRLLDPTGSGVMGSIEIPSIGVSLPIYHGVSAEVLQIGAGHIPGSSLPVGGANTHCVLSGHRGLPSSKLFTELDRLAVGEIFSLHVLRQTLTYEVYEIETVDPDEVDSLSIVEGEDLCTLVTCTPYGINTQRLLVHGRRVADTEAQPAAETVSHTRLSESTLVWAAVALLLILLIVLSGRTKKNRKKKGGNHK